MPAQKILVIEDDVALRIEIVEFLVRRCGFQGSGPFVGAPRLPRPEQVAERHDDGPHNRSSLLNGLQQQRGLRSWGQFHGRDCALVDVV